MRILSSTAILVLAVLILGACNSTDRSASNKATSTSDPSVANNKSKSSNLPSDGARRINVQEAQALVASGQAVVLDVRNQAAYEISHIRGAKLIPVAEVGTRSGELPKDKTIITYCS